MTRLLSASILTFLFVASAFAKELPNIIFILADDMGVDSVSAFNDEIGGMQTPHIDKLVKQGMTFTDGHSASSVCTPTRYGLLTGRYCWRTRLKKEVIWSYGQPLLEDDELTLAELLKEEGYITGMVGKWHLGTAWKTREGQRANGNILDTDKTWDKVGGKEKIAAAEKTIDWSKEFEGGPRDHGFDYFFGVDLPNMPPYTWLEGRKVVHVPTVPKPDKMFGTPGMMKEGWRLEDILPGLRDKACEWITDAAKKEEPFFLFMPLTSPHTPISPSEEFAGKSGLNAYVDFVIETDDVVGHVMDALEKTGEAEDTLVVFTADNGTAAAAGIKKLQELGVNLRKSFRAQKGSIYEAGHRVPLILSWPKVIKPGSKNDETVCLNDFLATFAEMTGRKLKHSEGVDSTSIWPLITGKKTELPEHPSVVSHSYRGQYSIRDGEWKLIFPLTKGEDLQLYNLAKDQKEESNVADQFPERVKTMTATFKDIVLSGRSTKGPKQDNHAGETSWYGLPW